MLIPLAPFSNSSSERASTIKIRKSWPRLNIATFILVALAAINLNLKALAQSIAIPVVVNPQSEPTKPISKASDYVVPVKTTKPVNSVSVIPTETKSKPQFGGYMGYVQPTLIVPVSTKNDIAIITTNVEVVGVSPELQEVVRQTIRTRPGGDTTTKQLNEDVAAILATGLFESASVSTVTSGAGLKVVYQVTPTVVKAIALVGAQALSPAIAEEFFTAQLGNTVSPSKIKQAVEQINQWYSQNNYVAARVLEVQPRNGVITITVGEGVVGEVKFQFLDKENKPVKGRTKESFLSQEVQVKPGQPFRSDLAQRDLQNLYQLGLFDKAEVSLNGDSKRLDVTYNLQERSARAANVGGGYSNEIGLFGTLNYSDRNLGGINQILNGSLQVSRRDLQFNTSFTSPYRVSNPDRLGYTVNAFRARKASQVFDEDIRLVTGDRVREGQFGGGIKFFRPVDGWQTSVGLNYTRTSLRDSEGRVVQTDVQNNPLSFSGTGIDDLVTVSAGVIKDERDNSINPTQGSILSLSTEQSIPIGLGKILLNRIQANYSQFLPVSILGSKQAEVLAFNIQGGTAIGDLPPYQAFNLGGINSVRGYELGDVASGRSYVLASAEYRFPIYKLVGGLLFADFATDLGSQDTVLGEPGVVRGKPGTGFGYGAGLRVNSPIGLLRAEFGINDNGESRFQFGVGQRF